MTRTTCPHCGRSIALRTNGRISRHGPFRRPGCPGSGLEPITGQPLTENQIAFARHCFRTGDALAVARMIGVECPQPDLEGVDIDDVVRVMTDHARLWIACAVNGYAELHRELVCA